jgi:YbbR domain-containing protein
MLLGVLDDLGIYGATSAPPATLGTISYASNNTTVDVSGSVDVLTTLGTITYTSNNTTVSVSVSGAVDVTATLGTISYASNDTTVSITGLIDVNATLGTISYTSNNATVTVAAGQTFGVVGSTFKPDQITVTFRG